MSTATSSSPARLLTPTGARHYRALDGLRGLAVLSVMMLHFSTLLSAPADLPQTLGGKLFVKVFSPGWAGVDLFFVLSGFLITGILHDAKGSAGYLRNFYMRRVLRILPLYYGALLLVFLVPPLLWPAEAARYQVPLRDQLSYWLYVQNLHSVTNETYLIVRHFWSLAIEEQFYLVWPFVILALSRRAALRFCVGGVIAVLLFRCIALAAGVSFVNLYFITPSRLDGLFVGGALALTARGPGGLARLRPAVAPVIGIALVLLAVDFLRHRWLDPGSMFMVTVGYTVLALLFGAVLVAALESPDGPIGRPLASRALGFWGRYSYGLYVWHHILMYVLHHEGVIAMGFLGIRSEVVAATAYSVFMIALSAAVALVSWHAYEKWFLELKRYFEYERPVAPAATEPADAPAPRFDDERAPARARPV